ncbi:MAG: polysaccharide biosynthesis protein, partial [Parcubacteria group bacterium]|nr:polysaccharide biosynthesis protein [Parcubacteria group bacterium]
TDERMTRFWLDLEKTFALVLFALEQMTGGEIFIPKAPVMRLADLFDAIVPKAKRKVVGIRPGEKLHEVLLTREESRHAVDLGKYFVVLPEHAEIPRRNGEKFVKIGKKLDPDFCFTSENHNVCLTKKELAEIVSRLVL